MQYSKDAMETVIILGGDSNMNNMNNTASILFKVRTDPSCSEKGQNLEIWLHSFMKISSESLTPLNQ